MFVGFWWRLPDFAAAVAAAVVVVVVVAVAVVVGFTLNRYFYPATSSTPSVRADHAP